MNIHNDVPTIKCHINEHEKAHHEVLNNPYWFSDKPQLLSETFSAEKTKTRSRKVLDILRRAEESQTWLSDELSALVDKLAECDSRRCGSSACFNCLRAFQQAKTAAHQTVISEIAKMYPKTLVYLVTIIPLEQNYLHNTFHEFDAEAFKGLLDKVFNSGCAPFAGSVDFSLEASARWKYIQPHFHLIIHTSEPELLREYLKWYFPSLSKYEYPVDVTDVVDFQVVPYVHKVLKANSLLRNGRRFLPELLVARDRIKPLDLLVTHGLVLSAHDDGFKFEIIM